MCSYCISIICWNTLLISFIVTYLVFNMLRHFNVPCFKSSILIPIPISAPFGAALQTVFAFMMSCACGIMWSVSTLNK